MPIVVNLDVMMAKRKMSLNELSARVDITLANLSILKNNHARRGGLWLSVFCYIQKNIIEIR